jgi:SAM-dependent methyltransferase
MFRKYKISHPLDSPERTMWHRQIILEKKFLRKLYERWYQHFLSEIPDLPEGELVELGSGGGFLKDLEPRLIATDLLYLPTNDLTFSALEMPFKNNSVAAIFMVDTLHHIPDMKKFFREVERVLVAGGKIIMIEPANTLWGRFIYTHFHHEPFNPRGNWTLQGEGPLSNANGALPWIVFHRDKEQFDKKFPSLKTRSITFCNPLLYLLSGGLSYQSLLPSLSFPVIAFFDSILPRISKQISMFQIIKITRGNS